MDPAPVCLYAFDQGVWQLPAEPSVLVGGFVVVEDEGPLASRGDDNEILGRRCFPTWGCMMDLDVSKVLSEWFDEAVHCQEQVVIPSVCIRILCQTTFDFKDFFPCDLVFVLSWGHLCLHHFFVDFFHDLFQSLPPRLITFGFVVFEVPSIFEECPDRGEHIVLGVNIGILCIDD